MLLWWHCAWGRWGDNLHYLCIYLSTASKGSPTRQNMSQTMVWFVWLSKEAFRCIVLYKLQPGILRNILANTLLSRPWGGKAGSVIPGDWSWGALLSPAGAWISSGRFPPCGSRSATCSGWSRRSTAACAAWYRRSGWRGRPTGQVFSGREEKWETLGWGGSCLKRMCWGRAARSSRCALFCAPCVQASTRISTLRWKWHP